MKMSRIFEVARALAIVSLLALAACGQGNGERTAAADTSDSGNIGDSERPWNIVFVLADDMAWNQVGYHDSSYYETPNIDSIARQGMQFSNAYSANAVCSPTRASLMTGKSPARLGLTDYIPGSPYPYARLLRPGKVPALGLGEITVAEMLKSKGYATAHFGKWHLNVDKNYEPDRPGDPASQGFDEVLTTVKPEYEDDPAADAHSAVEITERSLDFIDRHRDVPFFLYVSHHVVHRPLLESPDLVAEYEAKPGSDDPVNNPVMGAMIETMDNGIGQILERIDQYGLADRTVVIFYSDNGGLERLQDQAPYRGGKATIWEGGVRVPLAVRWPGVVEPGTVNDELVTSDDFFPTLAEVAGEKALPEDLDGVSLVPPLTQAGTTGRDTLYFHYPHYHHLGYKPAGAIRQGDYKLIEWFEGSIAGVGEPYSLYDLAKDPGETEDIAADHPELVRQMAGKLEAWRKEVGAGEMTVNPGYEPERADWRFIDEHGGDAK